MVPVLPSRLSKQNAKMPSSWQLFWLVDLTLDVYLFYMVFDRKRAVYFFGKVAISGHIFQYQCLCQCQCGQWQSQTILIIKNVVSQLDFCHGVIIAENPSNNSYFGPKQLKLRSSCFRAQKILDFHGPTLPMALVIDLPASKTLHTGPYKS